jgi:prepilin-type N-terminal cleavage/methylation domain-containing protein
MRLISTPLLESRKLISWKNEQGFSLLEVVVALTILAGGFLTVLNLFSGSVLSVDFSGQYLKAVTLASAKINELEILNFQPDEYSGKFKNEESYRWEVEIEPHDSPLNDPESGIQLQEILLIISWEDRGQTRNVELSSLHMKGQTYPALDSSLEKLFAGGTSPGSSGEGEGEGEGETSEASVSRNISGAKSIENPSKSCPSGQVFIFGGGCTTP